MREVTEINIKINLEDDSESEIADKIEHAAKKMHQKGWYFVESKADALLENVTLFFERDLDLG